jgi:PAS domain S-box-containing protein
MTLGRDGVPLCVRAGRNGKARFLRWSGNRFEPASDGFDRNDLEFEAIGESPDGAIWGVGRGTILRWENKPGRWQWHPELPPPVGEDRSGRMWFADGNRAVALAGTEVITVPGLRAPLAFDPQGGVWGNGTNGLARWTEAGLESIPEAVAGLASVKQVVADGAGVLWFDGTDSADVRRLASVESNRWTRVRTEAFAGQVLSQPVPDTGRGIWMVTTPADRSGFTVYRVRGAEPERQDIAEGGSAFGNPRILADSERVYLMGYRGLWESPKAQPWHLKASDAGQHVFNAYASLGDVSAFTSQEGPDGSARVHVHRDGQWFSHPVRHGQSLWLGEDGWLLVGDGSEIVLWQAREWSTPTYLGLPVDTTILSMVRAHDATIWIQTRMGVIGMNSDAVPPPETLVEGPERFVEGTEARVMARGAEAFASLSSHRRFSLNWRLDSQEWSGYGDWPENGLVLGNMSSGHHALEVRARDGLGNEDPTPARLEFEVLRAPIEDRRWFRPALGAVGLSFALLSLSLLGLSRRLRRQAKGLEAEVRARTSELEADVNRRREAELAALQLNERLGLALQAGLFGVWDWDAATNHSAWDDRMYEIFGLDRSEFDGSHESWFHRIVPEDRPQVESAMRRALETETTYASRYRILLPNGSIRHVAAEGYVNRDASGRLIRVIGLNADVTEQETTREELLRREDRIRRLNECISSLVLAGADPDADQLMLFRYLTERVSQAVRTARVGIWRLDEDRVRMHCALLFGADERQGTSGKELVCADFLRFIEALEIHSRVSVEDLGSDPRTAGMVEGGFAPRGTQSILAAAIRVGGRLSGMICIEHVGPPRRWHPDEQGFVSTVAAILAQTLETAERRRAEGELLKNRDLLNATGSLAGVGGWELAVTGSIPGELTWTDKVRHIHEVDAGFRPDLAAAVGFVAPESRPRFEQAVADLLARAKPFDLELVVITAKGRRVPVRSIGNPEIQDGRVVRVVGAIQDISDRRLAEAALREERVRLASIIEAARVGTWEWNVQTGETVFNERWAEILGHSLAELVPVTIQTWIRLTHPEDLARSDALLQEHFSGKLDYYECECRMRHRDGHWVWIQDRGRVVTRDASGRPLMMFGTHTDVTERRQSEERQRGLQELLNRAERMESVGRLAGGLRMTSTTCSSRSWATRPWR